MSETIKFGNLTITIKLTPQEALYTFVGDVDEHFRQREVPRIKRPTIRFVLGEINNFNSCGIREWIYLVRDLGECGDLRFQDCSVTMIDQINMVPDSLGRGTVESFFAPYYCQSDSCSGEVNRLIQVDHSKNELTNKQAPLLNCESCGKPLEFDALEESYFLFAESTVPQAS
jgi:hypothetical protein